MSKFKVGDRAEAQPNAWSKVLVGDYKGRIRRYTSGITVAGIQVRAYRIIAVDCKIPIDANAAANTLVLDEADDDIIAVNDCNLMPYMTNIDVQFVVAGENVTAKLSEESKKEVLRAQLRSHGA